MQSFSEVWEPTTGLGIDRQEIDDERFRAVAAANGIWLRNADEALPESVVVVAIELFRDQLAALDAGLTCSAVPWSVIQLVNLNVCGGPLELKRLMPGLGMFVPNSPIIAVRDGSRWTTVLFGARATDVLKKGMPDLIVTREG